MCTSKKPPKGADLIQKLRYFAHAFSASLDVHEEPTLTGIRDFIRSDAGPEDADLFTTTMWTILADLPFRREIGLTMHSGASDILGCYSKGASRHHLMEIGYALHSLIEAEIAQLEDWSYIPKNLGLPVRSVPLIYLNAWRDQLRKMNKGGAFPEAEAIATQIEAHTR